MSPHPRGALSRLAACVIGSRFAKPIARVVLVAAGLLLLAVIGRTSIAGTFGGSATPMIGPADASAEIVSAVAGPEAPAHATLPSAPPSGAHGPASADDPVVLNTADAGDLRRLPGIGEKRANAIVVLRTRLGRFRAIEDLLKVKGIGRAMLKRLRPLVRLDGAPADASAPAG
jgi:competence protein ComEA